MSWTAQSPSPNLESLCEWLDTSASIRGEMKKQVENLLSGVPGGDVISQWLVGTYKEAKGEGGGRNQVIEDTGFNSPVLALFIARSYKSNQNCLDDESKRMLKDFDFLATKKSNPEAVVLNVIKTLEMRPDMTFDSGMSLIKTSMELWGSKSGRVVKIKGKMVVEVDGDNPPYYNWWDVDGPSSEQEGESNKNCGNSADAFEGDRVYALRQWVGTDTREVGPDGKKIGEDPRQVRSCLTVIYNNGFLGEMKGYNNSKPGEQFYPYLQALMSYVDPNTKKPLVKGICAGMGYSSEQDFHYEDFDGAAKAAIKKANPELIAIHRDRDLLTYLKMQKDGTLPEKFYNPGIEVVLPYLNKDMTITEENLTKLINDPNPYPRDMKSHWNKDRIAPNWEKAAQLFSAQLNDKQREIIFKNSPRVACKHFADKLTQEQLDLVIMKHRELAVEYLGDKILPETLQKWFSGERDKRGMLVTPPHLSAPFMMSVLRCLRFKNPDAPAKERVPYLTTDQIAFILKNLNELTETGKVEREDNVEWRRMFCRTLLRYQKALVGSEVVESVEQPDPKEPNRMITKKVAHKPLLELIFQKMPVDYLQEAETKDLIRNLIPATKELERTNSSNSGADVLNYVMNIVSARNRMPHLKNALTQEMAETMVSELKGGASWVISNAPYFANEKVWTGAIKSNRRDDLLVVIKNAPIEMLKKNMSELEKTMRLPDVLNNGAVWTSIKDRGLVDNVSEETWNALGAHAFEYMASNFPEKISRVLVDEMMKKNPQMILSKYSNLLDDEMINGNYHKYPDKIIQRSFDRLNDANVRDAVNGHLKAVLAFIVDRGKKSARAPENMLDEGEFNMIINGQTWMVSDSAFMSSLSAIIKGMDISEGELNAILEKQPAFAAAFLNSHFGDEKTANAISRIPDNLNEAKAVWSAISRWQKSHEGEFEKSAKSMTMKLLQIPKGYKEVESNAHLKEVYNGFSEDVRDGLKNSPALIPDQYGSMSSEEFNRRIMAINDPDTLHSILTQLWHDTGGSISKLQSTTVNHIYEKSPKTALKCTIRNMSAEQIISAIERDKTFFDESDIQWSRLPAKALAMAYIYDPEKAWNSINLTSTIVHEIMSLDGGAGCMDRIMRHSSDHYTAQFISVSDDLRKILESSDVQTLNKVFAWRYCEAERNEEMSNTLFNAVMSDGDVTAILNFIRVSDTIDMLGTEKIRQLYDKYLAEGGNWSEYWEQAGIPRPEPEAEAQ